MGACMIDPKHKLRLWAIRLAYAVVLQFVLLAVLHYNPQSEMAALVFLTAHIWFIVTYLAAFWYLQQLITYNFHKNDKERTGP